MHDVSAEVLTRNKLWEKTFDAVDALRVICVVDVLLAVNTRSEPIANTHTGAQLSCENLAPSADAIELVVEYWFYAIVFV